MSRSFTILLDCDGPLADFSQQYLNYFNEMMGTSFTKGDIDEWDILSSLGLSGLEKEEARLKMHDIVCTKGYCMSIEPQPWAKYMVDQLKDMGHVIVVTSPWRGSIYWMGEREKWLGQFFGIDPKDVIFAHRKNLVMGDCLIDDKVDHVHKWAATFRGRSSILFPTGANRSTEIPRDPRGGPSRVNRATSWKDVVSLVEGIGRHLYPGA
jgi:5'(3')-deoxyribonucleotidase